MARSWSIWFNVGRRGSEFSFCSAPGAKTHSADAQLPAYWRIEGRNDTSSDQRAVPRRCSAVGPALGSARTRSR